MRVGRLSYERTLGRVDALICAVCECFRKFPGLEQGDACGCVLGGVFNIHFSLSESWGAGQYMGCRRDKGLSQDTARNGFYVYSGPTLTSKLLYTFTILLLTSSIFEATKL